MSDWLSKIDYEKSRAGGATVPEQIVEFLNPDERRMVLSGRVDKGGEGSASWEHIFGLNDVLWERHANDPFNPRLTKLGRSVMYAIAARKAKGEQS